MSDLKVGSFNIKNNGLDKINKKKLDKLSDFLEQEDFDILGLQELTYCSSQLLKNNETYKFYGSYRYGELLSRMPYNENNGILIKDNGIRKDTIHLPFIPSTFNDLKTSIVKASIMPRIAVVLIVELEDKRRVCVINTHLDYQLESVQLRQLKVIKDLVQKYKTKYPVILTGDFNMDMDVSYFSNFVNELKDLNTQRVVINEATWKSKSGSEKKLDHIFIPNNWIVEDAGIIDTKEISDHNAVYVKTKMK